MPFHAFWIKEKGSILIVSTCPITGISDVNTEVGLLRGLEKRCFYYKNLTLSLKKIFKSSSLSNKRMTHMYKFI